MESCNEWQVIALCIIFFILFLGNFITTFVVVRRKYSDRISDKIKRIKLTYSALKNMRSFSEKSEEKVL